MDKDGYVAVGEIAQFNRIKALTTHQSTLLAAVELSDMLDVSGIDGQFKIRARRASVSIEQPPTLGVLDRAEAAISSASNSADVSPDVSPATSPTSSPARGSPSPVSLGGETETAEESPGGGL